MAKSLHGTSGFPVAVVSMIIGRVSPSGIAVGKKMKHSCYLSALVIVWYIKTFFTDDSSLNFYQIKFEKSIIYFKESQINISLLYCSAFHEDCLLMLCLCKGF